MTENHNKAVSTQLKEKLSKIKHLALDMDGTIYLDNDLFDGTIDFQGFTLTHNYYADGNKILDEKVRGYEPPRAFTLNVSGVNELTFKIAAEDIEVVVADAVLWKSGQDVKPVTRQLTPVTTPKELVKDIKPYYVGKFMTVVTPDEHYIMLNRQTYEYGLRGNMDMALIGTNKASVYFNLRRQFSKLSFIAGCHDDLAGGHGSGWITVKADGKIIEEIEAEWIKENGGMLS